MIFRTRQKLKMPTHQVSYTNKLIEKGQEFKYLRMTLDPQLSFGAHVNYLNSKPIGKIK